MARSRRRALLAVAAATGVPLLVACNALIGLDDFDKVECSGLRCGDAGLPDVTPDVSLDAKPDAAEGADPVSWARWRMPNYDGGPDANLSNPPAYDTSVPGEVLDTITKLVWQKKLVDTGGVDFDEKGAAEACARITPGRWRLPKRIEVVTLLDYGRPAPFINPAFDVPAVKVWSSSEVRPFVGGAEQKYWAVDFEGAVVQETSTQRLRVLCVKGDQP